MRNGKKYKNKKLTAEEIEIRQSLPVDKRRRLISKYIPEKRVGIKLGQKYDVDLQNIVTNKAYLSKCPHMEHLMDALKRKGIKTTHKQQTFYHDTIQLSTKVDGIGYSTATTPPSIVILELKTTTHTLQEHIDRYKFSRGTMEIGIQDTDFNMDALQVGFGVLCVRNILHALNITVPVIGVIAKICRGGVRIYEIAGNHITTSPVMFMPLPSPTHLVPTLSEKELNFDPWPDIPLFNDMLYKQGYYSVEQKYNHPTIAIKSPTDFAVLGVIPPRSSSTLRGVRFNRHYTHIKEKRFALYKKHKHKKPRIRAFIVYLLDNKRVVFENVLGRRIT